MRKNLSIAGPLREAPRSPRRAIRTAAVCGLALAAAAPQAFAQGWDPFSQLDTNRWEQRSKRQPATKAPPSGGLGNDGADRPAEPAAQPEARDAYLQVPARAPRFGENSQVYYPPPAQDRGPPPAPETRSGRPAAPAYAMPDSQPRATRPPPPVTSRPGAPPPLVGGTVERGELTPVMAGDGSALPYELWRGLDLATVEKLIASLEIPPRSPALHDLWKRLIVSDVQAPQGGQGDDHFEALRLEALYRSGLLGEIREHFSKRGGGAGGESPLVAMLQARSEIGLGRRDAGCDIARRLGNIKGDIPKSLRGEAILVSGYCAAASGDAAAAGLLAELAREEGLQPSPGLAALDALALGTKTDITLPQGRRLSLIDHRILELGGATPPAQELVKIAAPALLVAVANDPAADADRRLVAAEAAARINALDPDVLASTYRAANGKIAAPDATLAEPAAAADTPRRRALLYASAEGERTPFKKVRLIRSYLDSAHRAGLYVPALVIAAKLSDSVGLVPEIGWFAETAIESYLASGNYERARAWTKFAQSLDTGRDGRFDHWHALIDIADPHYPEPRGQGLTALERMALMGRFQSDSLHRLATVLDALEYNVPIPLWEAASRTPQPAGGHLPETGVLSALQDAAKKREFGRTVLLAMQTLGPGGAESAHMIALGDAMRALKRAGLEKDARRLGLEALLAAWPRSATN